MRTGVVHTRVNGKPDKFDGGPMKYADWSLKLRLFFGAVDPAVSRRVDDDRDIVDTETQRNPRQRRKRTQHADVLHSGDDNCKSRVGQVSQCRRERSVRGLEAVRDGVGAQASNEVCGTLDECAGVPIQSRHSKQAGGVRENRTPLREPSTKTVDDDIKMGVTMLEMEEMQVKEHLIQDSVRISSWNQMREEVLEITRTQQYTDSQPSPMQRGAIPKRGQRLQGQKQVRPEQRQGQGCKE